MSLDLTGIHVTTPKALRKAPISTRAGVDLGTWLGTCSSPCLVTPFHSLTLGPFVTFLQNRTRFPAVIPSSTVISGRTGPHSCLSRYFMKGDTQVIISLWNDAQYHQSSEKYKLYPQWSITIYSLEQLKWKTVTMGVLLYSWWECKMVQMLWKTL